MADAPQARRTLVGLAAGSGAADNLQRPAFNDTHATPATHRQRDDLGDGWSVAHSTDMRRPECKNRAARGYRDSP